MQLTDYSITSITYIHYKLSPEPQHQGKEKNTETIKRASPVAWQNINLKGKYMFAGSGEAPDIEDLMASIDSYLPVPEKY
jgi:hypothetical protein